MAEKTAKKTTKKAATKPETPAEDEFINASAKLTGKALDDHNFILGQMNKQVEGADYKTACVVRHALAKARKWYEANPVQD